MVDVTPSNCVPMFMYTSVLGLHALADAVKGLRTDEEGFLDNFIMYLNLHRGVRAVTQQFWDVLKQSRLSPALNSAEVAMGAANSNNQDRASSVASLLYRLLDHSDMGIDSKTACRDAVAHLQKVYETQPQGEGSCEEKLGGSDLIWAWPVLLSAAFTELLVKRQSEALVILCHYAVLLHERRGVWLVGNAGSYWRRWLELPYEVLEEPA
ncbi:hypothetical protein yc1106_08603 [Curvularia clavata]|uniref:Uncharacterized protein n=1 Tax=Curvularia clavata TaxID=95742 RepID=A0A9Q8ZEQ0_CURCL|nr:hypothetical protein yc1106_08603 [Curvularia clavata]